ncbi:dolichyl-diphosphooligosaccharide--protein glycosyltransferase, putative [Plasmodium chabaudi adami]|uniref:Dolichyl-diphosphooligosaccharide--protein glycosyltransferase 48 kDa subunit n=1 Tax=Plasmodium chabaudi adami TaxID=5826 RepID=A0A1D3RUA2_PLACE|nr:dolichyl-diphosphooligosaccharide--protein glycosyltransferase, putative [Plasmodium chabaudi adami]
MMKRVLRNAFHFLVVCFFINIKLYSLEKIKLKTVDINKESQYGVVKNKIEKFNHKKLVFITNIKNYEQAYNNFLNTFKAENDDINFIKKVVYIDDTNWNEKESEIYKEDKHVENNLSNDDTSNYKTSYKSLLNKLDYSLYDGLVIVLDVLNDYFVQNVDVNYIKLFIEKKKDIFLSLNTVIGKKAINFLRELNIQVYGNHSYVNDHFNNFLLKNKIKKSEMDINNDKKTYTFYTNRLIKDSPIIKNKEINNILFKGTAHTILLENKYYLDILGCTKTCLLYDKGHNILKKKKQGEELSLISSIQLENNSRLIFSSSSEIFSDIFFILNEQNKTFTKNLIMWNFKMSGIIRYNNFKIFHDKYYENNIDKLKEAHTFFINDYFHMSIDFYELINNYWVPYKKNDIQFNLIKIDIIYRNFLDMYTCDDNPTYYKKFKLPNKHGIYKLQIYYLRKGYNILDLEYFIPVRTLLHYDKNKKVNFKNYPFYLYIYISLFCFFLFVLIMLFDNSEYDEITSDKKNN